MHAVARLAFNVLPAIHTRRLIYELLRMLTVAVVLNNFFGTAGSAFDVHVITIMTDEHMADMETGSGRSACRIFNCFLIHTFPYKPFIRYFPRP